MARMAYADPPYLGSGRKRYAAQHPDAAAYDDEDTHRALIGRLVAEFPDGWALSMGSSNLRVLLPLCPPNVRVGAWVKGFCNWKPGIIPAYAWEPVIFTPRGARGRDAWYARDWVEASMTTGRGVVGAKPDAFCFWVFALLGLGPADELVDLFPGSGAVTAAWQRYRRQMRFGEAACV